MIGQQRGGWTGQCGVGLDIIRLDEERSRIERDGMLLRRTDRTGQDRIGRCRVGKDGVRFIEGQVRTVRSHIG